MSGRPIGTGLSFDAQSGIVFGNFEYILGFHLLIVTTLLSVLKIAHHFTLLACANVVNPTSPWLIHALVELYF
jgi:hypothetical protein